MAVDLGAVSVVQQLGAVGTAEDVQQLGAGLDALGALRLGHGLEVLQLVARVLQAAQHGVDALRAQPRGPRDFKWFNRNNAY